MNEVIVSAGKESGVLFAELYSDDIESIPDVELYYSDDIAEEHQTQDSFQLYALAFEEAVETTRKGLAMARKAGRVAARKYYSYCPKDELPIVTTSQLSAILREALCRQETEEERAVFSEAFFARYDALFELGRGE